MVRLESDKGGAREGQNNLPSAEQADQIDGNAVLFADLLVKSFRYSKGNPIAQAEYLLTLKQEKGIDLLAFSGETLMENDHIREQVLQALKYQHPAKAEIWKKPVFILTREITAALSGALRLEEETQP